MKALPPSGEQVSPSPQAQLHQRPQLLGQCALLRGTLAGADLGGVAQDKHIHLHTDEVGGGDRRPANLPTPLAPTDF